MAVSTNSVNSPPSKPSPAERPAVLCGLLLLAFAALVFVQSTGRALHSGDAAAHLNIARRLVDGQTLGYHQIGTVWLPLPHLLFAPLVQYDPWWQNGLAGAIPSALAWVLAAFCFYLLLRQFFSVPSSLAGLLAFATNLNLLYLAATPMTETIFFASLLSLLYAAHRSTVGTHPIRWAAFAGLAACAGTLTRYEGWFLLPFVALYLLLQTPHRRWPTVLVFCALAGAGPLYWLIHNAIFYSDPLEFYRGVDSARAILQRGLEKGYPPHPGDHDWPAAFRQFAIATKAVNGWPLLLLAACGLPFVLRQRPTAWLLFLMLLSPLFYVMSLHSGGTPIYVPEVYPFSHYNTRYALAALPLLSFSLAGLAQALPVRAWLLGLVASSWFLVSPVLTWNEADRNSRSRLAWTRHIGTLLTKLHRPGDGIFMPFGDLTATLQFAGIPLRECLHNGDLLAFERVAARPDLFLRERWAIVIATDPPGEALHRAVESGLPYSLLLRLSLKNAPVVEVWQRRLPPVQSQP
ncbi:MAG: glycosyltransferase family 39 protein [Bryobacter sp.]|nr:glycosyltransferase family 39 protein [Bryobacter sp.]